MRRRSTAIFFVAIALCSAVVPLAGCRETVVGQGSVSTSTPATSTLPPTGATTQSPIASGSVTPSESLGSLQATTTGSSGGSGPSTGGVGETVYAGAWTMRVLGTQFVSEIKGSPVSTGTALRVTAQFKNPTQTSADIATFLALQAGGKAVAPSPKGGAAPVPGGQTINTTVYFPVTQQGAGYKLIFTEPGGSGKAMVRIN